MTFKAHRPFKTKISNVPESATTQSGSSSPINPEVNIVEKRETTRTATSGSELAKYKISLSNYEIVPKKILRHISVVSLD